MDGNIYAAEQIVAGRLAELRADRMRTALIESARGGRRGLGAAVGAILIRAGRWLARGEAGVGSNAGVRVAR